MTNTPTAAEYLKHHGVLGMKWGKRKKEEENRYGGSRPKPEKREKVGADDIHAARIRQQVRSDEYIRKLVKQNDSKSPEERARIQKQLDKMADAYENNDDAYIANRTTTGEKWATGLAIGGVSIAALGLVGQHLKV